MIQKIKDNIEKIAVVIMVVAILGTILCNTYVSEIWLPRYRIRVALEEMYKYDNVNVDIGAIIR